MRPEVARVALAMAAATAVAGAAAWADGAQAILLLGARVLEAAGVTDTATDPVVVTGAAEDTGDHAGTAT